MLAPSMTMRPSQEKAWLPCKNSQSALQDTRAQRGQEAAQPPTAHLWHSQLRFTPSGALAGSPSRESVLGAGGTVCQGWTGLGPSGEKRGPQRGRVEMLTPRSLGWGDFRMLSFLSS